MLSARVPGPCTLHFGTMHHRTTFAKLISEFGLSGTSPPINTGTQPPRGPSFPKDWGHTLHGLGARFCSAASVKKKSSPLPPRGGFPFVRRE